MTVKLSLVLAALAFSVVAQAQVNLGAESEVAIDKLYAPEVGFDDNDLVEVVLDVTLPNVCWSKSKTEVLFDSARNVHIVKQFAYHQTEGKCSGTSALNFMSVVAIGRLAEGTHTFEYASPEGLRTKQIQVAKAPTSDTDNLNYAITTDVHVVRVIERSQPEFEVTLGGYLNSSCTMIEDIKTSQVGDVFVLLPSITVKQQACMPRAIDFMRKVTLKTPAPGRYLVHTRSVNGTSVNRLFTVE